MQHFKQALKVYKNCDLQNSFVVNKYCFYARVQLNKVVTKQRYKLKPSTAV